MLVRFAWIGGTDYEQHHVYDGPSPDGTDPLDTILIGMRRPEHQAFPRFFRRSRSALQAKAAEGFEASEPQGSRGGLPSLEARPHGYHVSALIAGSQSTFPGVRMSIPVTRDSPGIPVSS